MNPAIFEKYKYLLIGFAVLLAIGILLNVALGAAANPLVRYAAFVLFGAAGLLGQYYIYKHGGMIPKNGQATIHSKIIFYASVFAVVFILAIMLALRLVI